MASKAEELRRTQIHVTQLFAGVLSQEDMIRDSETGEITVRQRVENIQVG